MQWPSLTRPLSRMREHSEPRQGRYKRNMRVSNRFPFLGKPVSQAGREHSAENRICTVETDAFEPLCVEQRDRWNGQSLPLAA